MKTWEKVSIAVATILLVSFVHAEEGISANSRVELALADYAKLLCSAEFISHRNLEEAERHSGPLVTENIGSSYSAFSESDRSLTKKLLSIGKADSYGCRYVT